MCIPPALFDQGADPKAVHEAMAREAREARLFMLDMILLSCALILLAHLLARFIVWAIG